MTKKQQSILESYNRAKATELRDVYGKYSIYKSRSFEAIRSEMHESNGYGLRILSYNSQFYTCAYKTADGNQLVYHTAYRREQFAIA